MNAQMTSQEQDIRLQMLNSFMTCPHRDTDKVKEVHAELRAKDPLFYAHLACWYRKNGDIRDHNEVFSAMLITDEYQDNREVGLALFRSAPVFMKERVRGFIRGKDVKLRVKTGKKLRRGRKSVDEVRIETKHVGLGQRIPSSFKTEVKRYLKWLEENPSKFDAVAFRNARDLKSLYASYGLQIRAGSRARQILFEKKYPEDCSLSVFKKITSARTPAQAAKLIVEHKVPYDIAVGLIDKMTPSILTALINNMTPQQVVTNAASLQERGAYDNAATKKLVQDKLEQAKKSRKVSTLKSKVAKDTGRIKDEAIAKQLDEVADEQVKRKGQITLPTAIFVDRSGSMSAAIEIGKKCAALVSGATTADLHVVAFDNVAMPVRATDKTYTAWEKAFAPVQPGGSTSMGCALDYLLRKQQYVEQIVIITDEGENAHPRFVDVYPQYEKAMKVRPHVVVINIHSPALSRSFSNTLNSAGIAFDLYQPEGNDYYGLPGLVSLLSRKSKLDLVYEIMEEPLLTRKPFK